MTKRIEVLFSPAEFAALSQRDLNQTTCVVLDILRTTTSMVTALANGAEAIIPVEEIAEAITLKQMRPDVLLAGERNGVRICAAGRDGIDFDLGNSPREFIAATVRGRTIVMTTTNGTRALRAVAGAATVLVGSFLNLGAIVLRLRQRPPDNVLVVCSGTGDEAALEDTLAAGALCEPLWDIYGSEHAADSAEIARCLYGAWQNNLGEAMQRATNGRRLLDHPGLRDDVAYSLQRDTLPLLVGLQKDGTVRRMA